MTDKKTHGGARAGAGRKVLYDEKMLKITITLPRAYVDIFRNLGEGKVSLGVRRLLESYGNTTLIKTTPRQELPNSDSASPTSACAS